MSSSEVYVQRPPSWVVGSPDWRRRREALRAAIDVLRGDRHVTLGSGDGHAAELVDALLEMEPRSASGAPLEAETQAGLNEAVVKELAGLLAVVHPSGNEAVVQALRECGFKDHRLMGALQCAIDAVRALGVPS